MSCYFRHIKDILNEAGINVTPDNKKQIDQAIHQLVGKAYKDCPTTWKGLKDIINDDERRQQFLSRLKATL